VHLYLFQQSASLSIQYLSHKLRRTYFVWRPSLIVSMATGSENYKIQCLSTFLSNELTTKPKKVDIIQKQSFFFCIVVSALNLACVLLRTLETMFYTCTFLYYHYYYPCVTPTFPLNGIKKYLIIITIIIIVIVMITKWL